MTFLFYCFDPGSNNRESEWDIDPSLTVKIWRPSVTEFFPKGVSLLPFGIWWAFHYLRVFSNPEYSLLLIYSKDQLVHRSAIFPGYFRFPFMGRNDLQIGDTWTDPDYRGKGLATFALHHIVNRYQTNNRKFWYVVEIENLPSIRVVEKAGFVLVGRGVRTKRYGVNLLGAYEIQG